MRGAIPPLAYVSSRRARGHRYPYLALILKKANEESFGEVNRQSRNNPSCKEKEVSLPLHCSQLVFLIMSR